MNRRQKFERAKDFAVFYGCGNTEDLSRFDIAIVEPAGQEADGIRQMQETGTLVIAYLSVMEVPPWLPETKNLRKEDFLHSRGEIVVNKTYGNFMADLDSPRWRTILLEKAADFLRRKGFDGLFLDTIANVEFNTFENKIRNRLLLAAADLVAEFKRIFPEYLFIQNNGIERVLPLTAANIDGLTWENPFDENTGNCSWLFDTVNNLNQISEQHGIKRLIIFEENRAGNIYSTKVFSHIKDLIDRNKILLYYAPKDYINEVNLNNKF